MAANVPLVAISRTTLLDQIIPVVDSNLQQPAPIRQRQTRIDQSHLATNVPERANAPHRRKKRQYAMFKRKRSKESEANDVDLVRVNLERSAKGFARVAAYVNSDNSTALHRRFGDLHARALLYKEIELTALETELVALDNSDAEKNETKWRNAHSIHHDKGEGNEARRDLMEKIVQKLEEYDDLLLRDHRLRKLTRPSQRTHRTYKDYIYLTNQIGREDQRFVYHEHDLVSLQKFEESWLDDFMHRVMGHCRSGPLRYLFVSRVEREKTSDPFIHYYSEARLGAFIKVLIAVASTALLLIPIYLFVSFTLSTRVMASITLIFAFLFATAISVFSSASRSDVFAATAAYCAVLVVFIGNIQQKQLSY